MKNFNKQDGGAAVTSIGVFMPCTAPGSAGLHDLKPAWRVVSASEWRVERSLKIRLRSGWRLLEQLQEQTRGREGSGGATRPVVGRTTVLRRVEVFPPFRPRFPALLGIACRLIR